jgi:hypothetical protein
LRFFGEILKFIEFLGIFRVFLGTYIEFLDFYDYVVNDYDYVVLEKDAEFSHPTSTRKFRIRQGF